MQQGSESFRLIVRRGPQPNQTYELNKDIVTLGRDITNDIVINDPEASRHHMRLTRGAGGYTIEDLGSTNGTFINGQRITGAKPLNNGDMVGLGETVTLGYEMVRRQSTGAPEEGGGMGATVQNSVPQQPSQPAQPSYQSGTPSYSSDVSTPPESFSSPSGGSYADAFNSPSPAPSAPPVAYDDYEEGGGNNNTRIILIGCAVFLVFCCCATIGVAIYVDSQCLWWQLPIVGDLLNAIGQTPPLDYPACNALYG